MERRLLLLPVPNHISRFFIHISSCRDCEMSPSSSVCFECFQSGNHKGHDFIFERSVYGGCCDCGNPHAWKSTGFCPNHTGSFSEDPSLIIPSDLKRVARIVLRSLIKRLYKYLPHTIEKVKILPGYYPVITGIVNWVRYIGEAIFRTILNVSGSFGEAMLHLIRLEFLYGQNPLPVEVYLNSTLSLQTDVLDEVLFLFLDLLQDPTFKVYFSHPCNNFPRKNSSHTILKYTQRSLII